MTRAATAPEALARRRAAAPAACVASALSLASQAALATDLHAYWDGRCGSCHGDSGPFVRSTLTLREGRLVGRHHGDDLPRFRRQHGLAAPLVDLSMAHAS